MKHCFNLSYIVYIYCGYEETDMYCISQSSVGTPIRRGVL